MSATDELRRLLDERGVEWSDASDDDIKHTTWNTASCWFSEFNDGWTGWGMSEPGTPEQAIAATLGRGTCEWVLEHSGTLYDKWRCSKCGYLFVESRVDQGIKDDFDPNYCPNCGARVERSDDE